MTCAGSVTSTSDVSGKKLKVLVTAYIDGKEVNQLVKEYETKGEILKKILVYRQLQSK